MSELVQIWDPLVGKIRRVENIRAVLYDSGKVVEFTVVTATRRWTSFMEYDKFCDVNPHAAPVENP